MYIVGIDPGPVVGIVRLFIGGRPDEPVKLIRVDALQSTLGSVLMDIIGVLAQGDTVLALEQFVVGTRAARSSTPAGGAAARKATDLVRNWAEVRGLTCVLRSAAEVKPWATDARLAAAGLMEPTTGMRHARDAARHALFAAVKTYGLPDPLSTRAGAR
jgi:hypothetical protein